MLPSRERDTLLMTVEEAVDLAGTGQATADTKPFSPVFLLLPPTFHSPLELNGQPFRSPLRKRHSWTAMMRQKVASRREQLELQGVREPNLSQWFSVVSDAVKSETAGESRNLPPAA
jgi:hypothetical protein